MYILELCCGWKSVTDVFVSEHGWDSTTVDILRKFKPTILADITKWDYRAYYRSHPPPDVIWASPPAAPSPFRPGAGTGMGEGGRSAVTGRVAMRVCVRASSA